MPMLVLLDERADGSYVPGRMMRASDLVDGLGEANNPEWKPSRSTVRANWSRPTVLSVFAGAKGKMEPEPVAAGVETELSLSLLGQHDDVAGVAFPILAVTKTHISAACGRNRCWYVSYR